LVFFFGFRHILLFKFAGAPARAPGGPAPTIGPKLRLTYLNEGVKIPRILDIWTIRGKSTLLWNKINEFERLTSRILSSVERHISRHQSYGL
jgi:hypothetical protein